MKKKINIFVSYKVIRCWYLLNCVIRQQSKENKNIVFNCFHSLEQAQNGWLSG